MTLMKQPPFQIPVCCTSHWQSYSSTNELTPKIWFPEIFYDFSLYFFLSWKPAGQGCVTLYFMCVIKQLCQLLRLYSCDDRWMNGYGTLVELYRLGKTKVLWTSLSLCCLCIHHMYWLGIEIGLRGEGPGIKPLYHGRARHLKKKEAKWRAAMEYSYFSVADAQRLKIVIIAL